MTQEPATDPPKVDDFEPRKFILVEMSLFEALVSYKAIIEQVSMDIDYGEPIVFTADFLHANNIYEARVRETPGLPTADDPPEGSPG